jgi:hypothetical protein
VNREELISAFLARGFDYMSNAEADQVVNDAYLVDICEEEDWPFKEGTATGPAPLALSEFGSLEYVIDTTEEKKLSPLNRGNLTDSFPTLSEAGNPSFYYLTEGKVLNVYPANTTDSLLVRYWKTPAKLTGSATPILPERWHSLIVDAAVSRAYEGSDDYELAQNAATTFQSRLQKMRDSLLEPLRDGPDQFVQITQEVPGC